MDVRVAVPPPGSLPPPPPPPLHAAVASAAAASALRKASGNRGDRLFAPALSEVNMVRPRFTFRATPCPPRTMPVRNHLSLFFASPGSSGFGEGGCGPRSHPVHCLQGPARALRPRATDRHLS